jgi:N-methylhydantoinase A/oxoprolinase/acetone carboxylase beta subunit
MASPCRTTRAALAALREAFGSLIIEEYDAITVVPPGWRAPLDAGGNIMIDRSTDI